MLNPLLINLPLPEFTKIKPEHVEPAIEQLIEKNLKAIEKLLDQGKASWEDLIEPIDAMDDALSNAFSPVSHLNSVLNTQELRDAYNACLPKLSEYASKIGQNERLYQAYQAIHDSSEFKDFNIAQKKVITNALRDFKLAGVALEKSDRERFSELKQHLSKLQSSFSDHVLDATDHWSMLIEDENRLKGLPEHAIESAKASAKDKGQDGFRFGIDFPSYHAIITYAEDRELRETIYRAFTTRASDQGPDAGKFDNSALMDDILATRFELARLLGFDNYAEYSLATKMANTPDEVIGFLENLAAKAKPFAERDFNELKAFVKEDYNSDDVEPWDIAFYSEKLRLKRYDLSQEALRPYFPLSKVTDGLFEILSRLYGMHVVRREDVDTYHEDVDFFEVQDSNGQVRGQFYFDLFARAHKRSGAWMDECRVRMVNQHGSQTPVAYITANFTPAAPGKPALLTHDEVITLFHEVGHGLHHILTQMDYPGISGINGVPWDAVELPSQFMENWCWEKEALLLISEHIETKEPLPDDVLHKMKQAKNFQAGLFIIRQLEFALFDFKMHHGYQKGMQIQAVLNDVREKYGVIPAPSYNRFQHSFNHIFSGGYAAGYYSYLWAELLSADAFSRFEEEGIFNAQTGQAFLTQILEKGGSQEPSELFSAFRGREPSIEPLLKHHGLTEAA